MRVKMSKSSPPAPTASAIDPCPTGEGSWGTRSSRSLGDNLELGGIEIEQSVITRWKVMLTATAYKFVFNGIWLWVVLLLIKIETPLAALTLFAEKVWKAV